MSDDDPAERDDCENEDAEPQDANEELPALRPFLYVKYLLGLNEGESTEQYKRYHYSDSPSGEVARILDWMDLVWRRFQSFSAETTIALFTAFLFVVTIGQLMYMERQVADQQRQTIALIESNKLIAKQAQEMVKQTGAMLGQNKLMRDQFAQMQEDQRALLSAVNPYIKPLKASEPVECRVTLLNAGQKRATVKFAVADAQLINKAGVLEKLIDGQRKLIDTTNRNNLIYPQQGFNAVAPIHEPLKEEHIKMIESGDVSLYFVVSVRYDDGIGGETRAGFCFIYDLRAKTLFAHDRYGYIDYDKEEPPTPLAQ